MLSTVILLVENDINNNINKIFSREEIVSKDSRVFISEKSRLKGSISLKGLDLMILF